MGGAVIVGAAVLISARGRWCTSLGMSDTSHAYLGLEPVLTTSELAAHLGVPVQTIHDLRHARRGPRGFRVGREMRYRLSEVQAWVEAMEVHDHAADLVDGVLR